MKTLVLGLTLTLLLLLPVPTRAPAQALTAPKTAEFNERTGLPNGRFWSEMPDGAKSAWLLGFSNGVFVIEALVHPTNSKEPTAVEKYISAAYESKLTLSEKLQGLNHFYQDTPENAPVAIPEALQYVVVKANGATQSQLDDMASGFRKASAQ